MTHYCGVCRKEGLARVDEDGEPAPEVVLVKTAAGNRHFCKQHLKEARAWLKSREPADCRCQPELAEGGVERASEATRTRWARQLAEREAERRRKAKEAGASEVPPAVTLREAEASLSPEVRLLLAVFGTMQDPKYLSPCEHVLDAADSFDDKDLLDPRNKECLLDWANWLAMAYPCRPGQDLTGDDPSANSVCEQPPRPASPHALITKGAREVEYMMRSASGEAVFDDKDLKDASGLRAGVKGGKRLKQSGIDVDRRAA